MRPAARERVLTPSFALLVGGAFCFFSSIWLVMILLPGYVLALGGTQAEIGMVLAAFAFTALLSRPIVGRLVDLFGRKAVAVVGCLIFATAPVLYILAPSVPALLVVRMFHGLGISFFTTAATTWVADIVPPTRRAEAMGLYSNASQIALAVAPLIGAGIYAWGGFVPVFSSAAAVSALGVVLIGLAREQKKSGERSISSGNFWQALGRREVLSMALTITTVSATWGMLVSFLPVFTTQRQAGQSAWFFTIYAMVAVVLRLVIGPMSDRLGRRIIIAPSMIVLATAAFLFIALSSPAFLFVEAVLYAASFGTIYPTLSAFLVDVVPANIRGSAVGVFTAGFDLGIALGSYGGGLVAQAFSLEATFAAAGIFCLMGLLIFLLGTRGST